MQIEERVKAVEVMALGMDTPVVMDAASPLRKVIRRMRDDNSGCALITRDGRLAGVFTERDLVARVMGTATGSPRPTQCARRFD
jgi:CBS domain-containing protein